MRLLQPIYISFEKQSGHAGLTGQARSQLVSSLHGPRLWDAEAAQLEVAQRLPHDVGHDGAAPSMRTKGVSSLDQAALLVHPSISLY